MFILISGVPGAGKTTVGDHLRDQHGFHHFDVEREVGTGRRPHQFRKRLFLRRAARSPGRVVVTWGFMPGEDDAEVEWLLDAGAALVWLDGDRAAAERHWRRVRPDADQGLFHAQIELIDDHSLDRFGDRIHRVDVFDEAGEHLPKETIADAVIAVGFSAAR